jgi:hypothetical protein
LRAVKIVFGAMQFTLIPLGPTWAATSWVNRTVNRTMVALAAPYGMGARPSARRPAEEAMVMTLPRAALFHPRQEALQGQERGQQVAVDRRPPTLLQDLLQRRRRREASAGVAMRISIGPRLSSI